jgi:prepilin-type processing-associated H-X9-DG protein
MATPARIVVLCEVNANPLDPTASGELTSAITNGNFVGSGTLNAGPAKCNMGYFGGSLNTVSSGAATCTLYGGGSSGPNGPHTNGSNFVLGDGHVVWASATQISEGYTAASDLAWEGDGFNGGRSNYCGPSNTCNSGRNAAGSNAPYNQAGQLPVGTFSGR